MSVQYFRANTRAVSTEDVQRVRASDLRVQHINSNIYTALFYTEINTGYILYKNVFSSFVAVVEQGPLLLRPFIGLLYQPWMIDDDDCGTTGGMNQWQGNPK
jgi:hypothetical protein